ncbi:MAG: intracellular septation protein [Patescibacteria group bacterium]|nr:intracellular septation protein [Patescibacteria group bacterium]
MPSFKQIPRHIIRNLIVSGFLEFGPVIVFLAAYDLFHIYKATLLLVIATIIATVISHHLQHRLPYVGLYIAFLTTVFGYLTLWHHSPHFIQLRDTVYDAINASILLLGLFFNSLLFKHAFHDVIPMTDRAWRRLTYAWIFFFFVAASLNEYVRHTYSLDVWVVFKTSMALVTTVVGIIFFFALYEKQEEKI